MTQQTSRPKPAERVTTMTTVQHDAHVMAWRSKDIYNARQRQRPTYFVQNVLTPNRFFDVAARGWTQIVKAG
jgi:hypothetical protein